MAKEANAGWRKHLRGDPLPWLLEPTTPAVRAAALRLLLDYPSDHPEVLAARAKAMRTDPIRSILDAQHQAGWWEKPGPGYAPKYSGTVWQIIFLDQLGADPADKRIRRGCEYVLSWCATGSGGFGASGSKREAPAPPSKVIHCLNGNLVCALIGFGWLDHPRVQGAIEWAARAITGEGGLTFHRSGTSGPGFACAANDHLPCAWGAIKELRGLARIPSRHPSPLVKKAIDRGVEFLLSTDPALADYPMGFGNTRPSSSWFKLGFPSGYVADVLQNLEVLTALGRARDPQLGAALELILSQQDSRGRWVNRYAYNGKTTTDIEPQGQPSKWTTLRACTVIKAVPA